MDDITDIWYFSGTGQCRQLAQRIASELKSGGRAVRTVNITPPEQRKKLLGEVKCGQLILVFPVYANGLPLVLKAFFKQLVSNKTPVIAAALWGAAHRGHALSDACAILKSVGFLVNGAAEVVSEHSFMHATAPICGNRPTEREKTELIEYIKRRIGQSDGVSVPAPKDSLIVKLVCSLPDNLVVHSVVKLLMDSGKCTKCGACIKMCPTEAVRADLSIDESRCVRCLSCVSNCKPSARAYRVKKIAVFALGHHKNSSESNRLYE